MSVKAVAALPQVCNTVSSQKTSARLKCEELKLAYGISVPTTTMTVALQAVRSTLLETAHTQLQGLGRLLQAFHDKNPQSTIVVDKDREGNLQRVFICPGAHKQVLDATLRISHNDAFHVKTHIINSNIAATSLLTNQRTNFL